MLDPFTMDELVPYTYFCRWYQTLNPGVAINDSMLNRYEDYTTDLTARTAKAYVERQAVLPWFRERYSDDYETEKQKIASLEVFKQDLERGAFEQFSISKIASANDLAMSERPNPSSAVGNVDPRTLFVRTVPSRLSKALFTKYLQEKVSDKFSISVSTPTSDLAARVGWIALPGDSNSQEVLRLVDSLVIDDPNVGRYRLEIGHYRPPAPDAPKRILWSQLNDEATIEQHLAQLEAVVTKKEMAIKQDSLWTAIKERSKENICRQLDLGVEYLRRVFYFDYWELQQYDSQYDLLYHSPGYARLIDSRPSDLTSFETWSTSHTKKFRIFLDPAPYLQLLRQKSIEETVNEVIQSKIRKEEGERYRCQVLDCTKLFKDVPFVQKHIEKRHGEWLGQVRQEAELLLRYLADPNKLAPYKEFQEPRPAPQDNRGRRRSPPQQRSNGYSGYNPRGGPRGPVPQNYRDLDRPAEELPELDY